MFSRESLANKEEITWLNVEKEELLKGRLLKKLITKNTASIAKQKLAKQLAEESTKKLLKKPEKQPINANTTEDAVSLQLLLQLWLKNKLLILYGLNRAWLQSQLDFSFPNALKCKFRHFFSNRGDFFLLQVFSQAL